MNIPSPRQLEPARFDRPDFRAPRRAKHRADQPRKGDWIWQRTVYRLKRWLIHARRNTANDALTAVQTLSSALRALRASIPARRPSLPRPVNLVDLAKTMSAAEQVTAFAWGTGSRRRSARSRRARLTGSRRGEPVHRHRLEDLSRLPHAAYLTALTARQVYVTGNLLRLKGLAASRAFGETSWREARRADHYATA